MNKLITAAMLAACLSSPALLSSAALAGDAEAGAKIFKKCAACHVADAPKNKTGPHLVGIFGRKAGSLDSFTKYSKAMKDSGIIWYETSLSQYLASPKTMVKGTRMAFAGLKKQQDRDNLIAYLKSLGD